MTHVDLNIVATKANAQEPWMWKLGREFPNLIVNIARANIDEDHAYAKVELEGPVEEIQRATAWLMTTGLHIEAEQRAVQA